MTDNDSSFPESGLTDHFPVSRQDFQIPADERLTDDAKMAWISDCPANADRRAVRAGSAWYTLCVRPASVVHPSRRTNPGAATETAADVLSGFHKGTILPSIPAALLGAALALLPAACVTHRGKSRAAGKVLASVCTLIPLLLAFAATLLLTRVNGIRLRDALRCLWPMRSSIGGLLL